MTDTEIDINCQTSITEWRYRFNPFGEREQKRMYNSPLGDMGNEMYPWVYYQLGIDNRQYAVYYGAQSNEFQMNVTAPRYDVIKPDATRQTAFFYPAEYNVYGNESAPKLTYKYVNGQWQKQFKIYDYLGSLRYTISQSGQVINYKSYEPYGNTILDTFSHPRQGYIGKEKDVESGLGDNGVRKYDPKTGMFDSGDPLSDKFPGISPYVYGFNNPIVLKDYNGKNAVAIVDGNNITIKAVYVVDNYSTKQIESMNKSINEYLNNAKYSVTEGVYSGKNVKFDLTFVEKGTTEQFSTPDSYKGIDISNTLDHKPNGNKYTITNTWTVDFTKKKITSTTFSVKGGITGGSKWIFMNDKYDDLRTRIHEIFHTLFFDYDDAKSGIGNYVRGTDMPNTDDINKLINNPTLQKVTK